MNQPKISVVTIVYNDVAHIKETMDSVINQSYPHIEYILIDGASTDGTREAIESALREITLDSSLVVGEYPPQSSISTIDDFSKEELENLASLDSAILGEPAPFSIKYDIPSFYLQGIHKDNPHFTFKFLSQKDSGIYDAMNKGIDLVSGQWCNFMNCGDRFYASSVLSDVSLLLDDEYDVVDGGVEICYDENHRKIKFYKNIVFGPFTLEFSNHQATFVKNYLAKKYYFDDTFQILGDMDFFAILYAKRYRWKKIQTIVASYNTNGISSRIGMSIFLENIKIGKKYMFYYHLTHTLYYLFYVLPRVSIRKILPKSLGNAIRQRLR